MAVTDSFIAQTAIVNGFGVVCCIKPLQVSSAPVMHSLNYGLAC
jgi:hypothetical protein